jgi:hypothetical protein
MIHQYTIKHNSGKVKIEAQSLAEAARIFLLSPDFDHSEKITIKAPYHGLGQSEQFITKDLMKEIEDSKLKKASQIRDQIKDKKNNEEAEKQTEKIKELSKSFGIQNLDANTDKLLVQIIEIQQKQFSELKKLNFKLMMFWIILVVIPIVLSMMQ